MAKKLIIVESPAKARTIGHILARDFKVVSSVGHVRDLPKTRFGVDITRDFKPEYVTISGKNKVIDAIKRAAKDADAVYLAADPDREGEAICWHLQHYLRNLKVPIYRILYYEVTPRAILNSVEHPGDIDIHKVDAQQGRRILDRIVGYRLSPLLWKKVRRGLSAGRVQSVALKIICDREREIQAFQPEEYWTLTARLKAGQPPEFLATYVGTHGKKRRLSNEDETKEVLEDIRGNPFVVDSVTKKKVTRRPPPPFITSTLQQEAARKLRFPAKKTMRIAQSLYEGRDLMSDQYHGLITYMRTDSPRVSKEAQTAARELIQAEFGGDYVPARAPQYKAGKSAQEAHEAIRPTAIDLTPARAAQVIKGDALKLYKLIWERFIASQMAPAQLNVTTMKINAGTGGQHQFRATGTEVLFEGYWKLAGNPLPGKKKKSTPEDGENEMTRQMLPVTHAGESLTCLKLDTRQNFTKPPPRFSEATLVKELERQGIGRPSTYASIMATIRNHDYVDIVDRRFRPTDLGFVVTDILTEYFPEIMSVKFTAGMENKLDEIEKGKVVWTEVIREFYDAFSKRLETAQAKITPVNQSSEIVKDAVCPECGGPMVERFGKKGKFLSCARYPDCSGTLSIQKPASDASPEKLSINTPVSCPECGAPLALKKGRYGLFLSCSRFPACKGKAPKPDGYPCPVEGCGGELGVRRNKSRRLFYGCSNYPDCQFVLKGVFLPVPCPHCGFDYLQITGRKDDIIITCPKCSKQTSMEELSGDGTASPAVSDIP